MKKYAKGLGLQTDTETDKDINRAASKKQKDTIKLNDDYREYCKSTTSPMAFIEFKSLWYKNRAEENRKKFQKPRKNSILDDKSVQKKIHRNAQTEYGQLCKDDPEFKNTITFKEFKKKKEQEFLDNIELQDKTPKKQTGKLSRNFWDKLYNDSAYRGALESRKDSEGCYTGSLGQAWGSPKVRYPKR